MNNTLRRRFVQGLAGASLFLRSLKKNLMTVLPDEITIKDVGYEAADEKRKKIEVFTYIHTYKRKMN